MGPFRPNERQTLKASYEVLSDLGVLLSWVREANRQGMVSYAFRQFHAPLEIYRGLQTVLIVSVSSRTAHRLLTASSCNAS